MSEKKAANIADRLAAVEHAVSVIQKQLAPTPPVVIPWWVKAYPEAYRNRKE